MQAKPNKPGGKERYDEPMPGILSCNPVQCVRHRFEPSNSPIGGFAQASSGQEWANSKDETDLAPSTKIRSEPNRRFRDSAERIVRCSAAQLAGLNCSRRTMSPVSRRIHHGGCRRISPAAIRGN